MKACMVAGRGPNSVVIPIAIFPNEEYAEQAIRDIAASIELPIKKTTMTRGWWKEDKTVIIGDWEKGSEEEYLDNCDKWKALLGGTYLHKETEEHVEINQTPLFESYYDGCGGCWGIQLKTIEMGTFGHFPFDLD